LEKLETNWWRCLNWTVLLVWHVKCTAAPLQRQQSHNIVQKDNHTHCSVSSGTTSYKKTTTLTAVSQHRTKRQPHSLQCQQSHNIVWSNGWSQKCIGFYFCTNIIQSIALNASGNVNDVLPGLEFLETISRRRMEPFTIP
jgi:hypothetical protein